MVHRQNEVGSIPARASQTSGSEGLHAKRVCFAVSRHQLACASYTLVRRQNLISKGHPERCQGASIADHLFNQHLFWTALHRYRRRTTRIHKSRNEQNPPEGNSRKATKIAKSGKGYRHGKSVSLVSSRSSVQISFFYQSAMPEKSGSSPSPSRR